MDTSLIVFQTIFLSTPLCLPGVDGSPRFPGPNGSVPEVTFITGRAEHTRVLLSFWLAAEVPAEVLHPLAQAAAEATRGAVPRPFPDP